MKRNKLSTVVFYTLIVLMILFVVSTYLSSGLVAKYTSTDSATDSARVAKWDIDFLSEEGKELEAIIASTHLDSGNTGSWGLDISNNSEVLARFSSTSNVKLRLQSSSFDVNHHHDTWDFLHVIENGQEVSVNNPINFQVHMYDCSLDEITDSNITKKEVLIFDTAVTNLKFDMVIEEGILYYETIVNLESLLGEDFLINYNGGKASLVVSWSVENIAGAVDTNNSYIAYHVVEVSEYKKNIAKYDGIVEMIKQIIDDKTVEVPNYIAISQTDYDENVATFNTQIASKDFTYDTKDYVIAYKNHNYFDYLIYSSSVGGEVMITLKDVYGKEYVKRSTKLSNEEITLLKERTFENLPDLTSLNLYIEKLGYDEYLKFENTQSEYNKDQGYISLGLTCRIILDLKVEQVD